MNIETLRFAPDRFWCSGGHVEFGLFRRKPRMTKPIARGPMYRRRSFDAEFIWHYLYRAVDRQGKTVDFLLRRDRGIHLSGVV